MFQVKYFIVLALARCAVSMCPYKGSGSASPQEDTAPISEAHRRLAETIPLEGSLPSSHDLSDPMVQANNYFHDVYDIARETLVPKVNIMREGDYLVLHLSNGSRFVEPIVHTIFHDLKMVCHLPLSAYSIVLANSSKSIVLDQPTMDRMSTFQGMLNNISITADRFHDPKQLERQRMIYNLTMDFVDSALATSMCSAEQMSAFAWSTSSYINLNLEEAAEDTINATHAVIMNWKDNVLSPQAWSELYTTITVGHMVVQEFSIQLYFVRLFGGSTNTGCGESKGWNEYDNKTFALGGRYSTEETIVTDVSTHYTDYAIGRDFFHELYRMHRDALSDGARKAIDKIFGPEGDESNSNTDIVSTSTSDDSNDVAQYWKAIAICALCAMSMLVVMLAVCVLRGKVVLAKKKEEGDVLRDLEATNVMH